MNGVTAFPVLSLMIRLLLIKGVSMYTSAGNVQLGCLYAETEDISLLEPTVDIKSMPKQETTKAALRTVINCFKSLGKRRAPVCSRAGGEKRKCLLVLCKVTQHVLFVLFCFFLPDIKTKMLQNSFIVHFSNKQQM